jgi:hypothetical protein
LARSKDDVGENGLNTSWDFSNDEVMFGGIGPWALKIYIYLKP